MRKQTTIYTSLPRHFARSAAGADVGRSYLAYCVRSWKRANFRVISLNNPVDIPALSEWGQDIGFKPVRGERPLIEDFLNIIRDSGEPLAGIINSDIFISDSPELIDSVVALAQDRLVIAERINIDSESLLPTGRSCAGFDAFIFATEPLSRIRMDFQLRFGEPWWDYWFPIAYLCAGGKLSGVGTPLLFHLDHPPNWRHTHWMVNGKKLCDHLLTRYDLLPADFVAGMRGFFGPQPIAVSALSPFGDWCFNWLQQTALRDQAQAPGVNHALASFIELVDKQDTRNLIAELHKSQSRNRELETMSESLVKSLRDFQERIRRAESPYELLRGLGSHADGMKVIEEAGRVLTSRKACLRHFFALNAYWLKHKMGRILKRTRDHSAPSSTG